MRTRERDRDPERLILISRVAISDDPDSNSSTPCDSPVSTLSSSSRKEALTKEIRTWVVSLIFHYMILCSFALLPSGVFSLVTLKCPCHYFLYTTRGFVHFAVDGFFSPVYTHLGINLFGLGFMTSLTFIFLIGVFMSSWLGESVLSLGEWFIKKMPLLSYIHSAPKQISGAISPDNTTHAFRMWPSSGTIGEYAFGFVTLNVKLDKSSGTEELCRVYVPVNQLYIGDNLFVNPNDIFEGIGMSIPQKQTHS